MPELVLTSHDIVGESPFWFDSRSELWWVDITRCVLHRLNTVVGKLTNIKFQDYISAVVPDENAGAIIASGHGIYHINGDSSETKLISELKPWDNRNRFNDGKCDPEGRFWVGTMNIKKDTPSGSLFMLDRNFKLREKIGNLTISNGLAWSTNKKEFYHIDTPTKQVGVYSYAETDGSIKFKKYIDLSAEDGRPDGMTIDSTGSLWIGMFGGGQVIRCDPLKGDITDAIEVPEPNVTSCCFGDSDLKTLYITTAGDISSTSTIPNASGNLYSERLNVSGIKTSRFSF